MTRIFPKYNKIFIEMNAGAAYRENEEISLQDIHPDDLDNYGLLVLDRIKKDRVLSDIIHNNPLGIICLERDNTISYINQKFTETFGYDLHDVLRNGKWLNDTIFDTSCKNSATTCSGSRQIEDADERETRILSILCKDGSKKRAELTVLRQKCGGRIIFLQELASYPGAWNCPFSSFNPQCYEVVPGSTSWRELAENSRDILYLIDDKGYFAYLSPAAKNILGYDPSEVIDRSLFKFVIEEDLQALQKDIQSALTGEIRNSEFRAFKNSGEVIWLQALFQPIFKDERIVGIQGSARSINDRKMAEKALDTSEEKYRDLVESIYDAIYSLDDKGYFTYVSPGVKNVAGWNPSEVIGKSFAEFVFAEDLMTLLDECQITLSGDTGIEELRVRAKSGEAVWVQGSGRPIVKDGRVVGIHGIVRNIDKMKKAENALRISEARFKGIYESSPIGIMLFSSDFDLIHANRAALDIFGIGSLDDILGINLFDDPNMPNDSREELPKGSTIRHEKTYDFERTKCLSSIQTSKSGKIEIYAIASPMYLNGSTNPSNYIIQVQDITETKRAKAQIIASENRFAEIFHISPDPLALTELGSGRIIDINRSFEELTGYSRKELLKHTSLELKIWAKPEEREHLLVILRDENKVQDMPLKLRRKDGVIRDAIISARNFLFGDEWHLLTQARDVTEINLAAEELRRGKAKYKAIVQDMPCMLCRFDQEGMLTYVNDEYCSYFGENREALVGRSILVHISEEDHKRIINCLNDLCAEKPVASYELKAIDTKGETRWIRWTTRALFDDQGKVAEYQSIGDDITEGMLAGEALIKAKEAAEAAAQAKSMFLANMSHEIRTPLNAIIGMTNILLDTQMNSEQEEAVKILRHSSNALMATISDILDFSKIEAGKRELEMMPFSLKRCLQDSLELIGGMAKKKGIALNLLIEEDIPENVIGEITCMRQVLLNLLSNAIKFTDSGHVMMSVCARNQPDGLEIEFSVKDTGVGISDDNMQRLFKPFSQADASLTRRYGGTGLGLAICKRLVELMGGRIWAESEPGKGSLFCFTMKTKPAPAVKAAKNMEIETYASKLLSDLRIILAEDSLVNQKVMLHMLKKIGIRADSAANGLELLQALDNKCYDIVLMDVAMPEMDGLEAARIIRQSRLDRPYIIAVTAHSLDNDKDKCLACGMNDYLAKPVQMEELIFALNRYIDINQIADRPAQ